MSMLFPSAFGCYAVILVYLVAAPSNSLAEQLFRGSRTQHHGAIDGCASFDTENSCRDGGRDVCDWNPNLGCAPSLAPDLGNGQDEGGMRASRYLQTTSKPTTTSPTTRRPSNVPTTRRPSTKMPTPMYTAPITGMALSAGGIRNYFMDVATSGVIVTCSTNGPNGDADLYLRFGSEAVPDPAFTGNACSGTSSDSIESCSTAATSVPTRVYAAVHAFSSFTSVTFQCAMSTRSPTRSPTSKPTTRKPTSKPSVSPFFVSFLTSYHLHMNRIGYSIDQIRRPSLRRRQRHHQRR